jgi:DNA-directed RNA polymerase specialized sigma24 family protein
VLNPPPTPEEFKHWSDVALRLVKKTKFRNDHLSLGPEAYAADAIEKLLNLDERPANIEGWLKTVIANKNYDHANRKLKYRYRDGEDPSVENERQFEGQRGFPTSLGTPLVGQERLSILLSALSDKDRDIVLLRVEGFDNFEIAERLGYASSRVVANRLRIIRAKMVEEFGEDGKELF